jgi:multiple sugar transport system substrate-binding protein
MKRWRRLAAFGMSVGLVVAGCGFGQPGGGGGGQPGGGGGGQPGQASGQIRYALWDSNQLPAYQACAKAFKEKNPQIDVKIEQLGWDDYWNNMTTGFVARTAPDVFTNHLAKYPEFAKNGQLVPLNDLIQRDSVKTDIYFPGLPELWTTADGKRYGLPKDWDTIAFAYNKKLVQDAGISEADLKNLNWNPRDGGSFEKTIARLTVDQAGKRGDEPGFDKTKVRVYGLGLENSGGPYGQTQWSFWAAANGWKYTNKPTWGDQYFYDDPKFVETVTWWRGLIEKGYMPAFAAATSGVGYLDQFGAGKYATVSVGSWQIGDVKKQKFETSFFPTPIGPTGKRASMFNGLADSIYVGTKNQEAAWQWVKFLASPDCQNLVGQTAVVFPAIPQATEIAKKARADKGVDVSAFTIHVDDKTTFTFPIADNASRVDAIMTPAMDSIMSFKSEPQPTLAEANKKVNDLFK